MWKTTQIAARAHAIGRAAAAIERDSDTVAQDLARSLSAPAKAWGRDFSLVFVGRDRDAAARDPLLVRYRVERAVVALAPPLAHALSSLAPEGVSAPSRFAAVARTLVRAAAEASGAHEPDLMLLPLARAAVATLVDQLFAQSVSPPAATRAAGLVRELTAFAAALE